MFLRAATLFILISTICLGAEIVCPPFSFLDARSVNMTPSATSHLAVAYQADGSYTAYELSNTSPYRVIRTTPHFERQFAACLPHTVPRSPVRVMPTSNPLGVASQPIVSAILGSGNYLIVSITGIVMDAIVVDAQFNLVSENTFYDGVDGTDVFGFLVSMALADVNGDGYLDLVALSQGQGPKGEPSSNGFVWVLVGNRDGTFQQPVEYPIPSVTPASVAIGDLNHDGKLDLAVISSAPYPSKGQIWTLFGKGDGTFGPAQAAFAGGLPQSYGFSVALADLNGDGKLDLVFTDGMLGFALGHGDGIFSPAVEIPISAGSIAIGDLDDDGIPDIVSNSGASVTVLFGDGKGSFPKRSDYLADINALTHGQVFLSDFDGDGKIDIILGSGSSGLFYGYFPFSDVVGPLVGYTPMTILWGKGGGAFTAAPISAADGVLMAITSGDFNGDSIIDLASLSGCCGTTDMSIRLGKDDGTFESGFQYSFSTGSRPHDIVTADFNHDGKLDIAVALSDVPFGDPGPGELEILLGNGDGTFAHPISLPAAQGFEAIRAADFNSDGKMDLAGITKANQLGGRDSVSIYVGQGDGAFAAPVSYPAGPGANSIAIADFNGDGNPDIVIANQGIFGDTTAQNIEFLLGKGDGAFSIGTYIPLIGLYPTTVVAADFNGDGRLDIAVSLESAPGGQFAVAVLLGNGDGTFQLPVLYPYSAVKLLVGDFNGDKIPDLCLMDDNRVSILRGRGDGTFEPETLVSARYSLQLAAADYNGDGKLDLAGNLDLPGISVATLLNLSSPSPQLAVVSAATFLPGPLAPNSIASAFGIHLANETAGAPGPGLPTELRGTNVAVRDSTGTTRNAPLFFVSPDQVNFLVPPETANGSATYTVTVAGSKSVSGPAEITSVAPSFFSVGNSIAAGYAIQVGPGNVQTTAVIVSQPGGVYTPLPIDNSSGDVYLILFGTGFDASSTADVSVKIQGIEAPVAYAGPQGSFAGLDQVNILLPAALSHSGLVSVVPAINGTAANTVYISIY